MLAGIAIGPFTPGFVGDVATVSQLAEANLRATAGASVVAIMREGELITNPDSRTVLRDKNLVGLIGNEEQLSAAQTVLAASTDGDKQTSPHST
jgi:CPA2 family monovalent cation:H+ antiporter-2